MRLTRLSALAALLSATQLCADVSFLTGFRFEPGAGLPQGLMESMAGSMPAMPVVRTRIKGTLIVSRVGALDMIVDTVTQELTLLDAASKTFATGRMEDYVAGLGKGMPAAPAMSREVEQMMSGIQFDTRKTDRTDEIYGIKVGEREISMSMKLPLPPMPAGDAPTPAALPSMEMKVLIHVWRALPSEGERVPALRELDAGDVKVERARAGFHPAVGRDVAVRGQFDE
jgi:hypothetical protein